jgi:ABC-type oligopeptide transport system substrate-binding subunit/class 3 adenylate cyclase/tetratricopeptide (TPR) repeat protein
MMDERQRIEQAIAAQESLRAKVGDEVVDETISMLRRELAHLETPSETLAQQRKLVTILFVDIVGSTEIVKQLDPEDALEIMDGSLKRLAAPVEQHGGHIARFMGDGFKAVFGMPKARENDPEMAIRAGLDILGAAQELGGELESQWGIQEFQVRVGINTGLAALGGMTEAEDTVMGSTVNLAKRIESAAPPGGLLITHHTYCHVRGIFNVEPREPIKAKGFDETIQVYIVLGIKPRAFRVHTRGVEGVETRMVGRRDELNYLQDALYSALEERVGHIFTITGEAGVGKSRLLFEFQNWIELLPETILLFLGQGRQETQNLPYALLRDLFSFRFQIQESDRLVDVRQKLEAGFGEVLGSNEAGRKRAHIIGQLLGFDFSDSIYLKGVLDEPQQLRDIALTYLGEFFQGITTHTPATIFLEDIHWADDSSLDAIDYLSREIAGQGLLIVCLARETIYERRPYWGEGLPYHTRLNLRPLSKTESRLLVAEILKKITQIPAALRELVISGAEGNPFYIEELIKMLVEDGVIITGDDSWRVEPGQLAEVEVPSTLTGVLQARLDSLPIDERQILQQAAVVGRVFWDDAVTYLNSSTSKGESEENVPQVLVHLRDREMVYRRETSIFEETREFTFKHAVLRDVTYESILKRVRRVYHNLVAEWLISHSVERRREYVGIIADHLELAGQTQQAIDYLLLAGDQARALYAHPEAITHYQKVLNLLNETGDQERAARTLMKLGLTYHTAFDYQRSRQAYERGFALWQQAGESLRAKALGAETHRLRATAIEPLSLDPTISYTAHDQFIICQLFTGLVELTPELDIVPALASSWDLLDDGRSYIFHLRDDVHWSDGEVVTAKDFEYAWMRLLNPATRSPIAELLYDIKGSRAFHRREIIDPGRVGVKAFDDLTLVVELEEPTGYFPYLLSNSSTYPIPRHVVEANGEDWTALDHIVTCGPFTLEAWQRGHSMMLMRNSDYCGQFNGNLSRVELSLIADPTASLEFYAADDLDIFDLRVLQPSERDRARQKYAGEYVSGPELATYYIGFNLSQAPFNDRLVRQAFAHATDRQTLADVTMRGYEYPANGGYVPPGMPGHSPGIGLPYDPELARQLLAAAGYPDGRGFPAVQALTHQEHEFECACLKTQWLQNLGIDITWKVMELNELYKMAGDESANIFHFGWVADYPDPDNFLRVSLPTDLYKWHHDIYQNLLNEARKITDQEDRIKLYRQADQILVAEVPILPLTYVRRILLVKPWVKNLPLTGLVANQFWKDVIIERK